MMPLFWLVPDKGFSQSRVSVCSEKCWNDFSGKIKAIIDRNMSVSPSTTIDGRYITTALKLAYISYIHENLDFLNIEDKHFRVFLNSWLEDKNQDIHWISGQKNHGESSDRLFDELHEYLLLKEKRSRANLLLNEAKHFEEEGSSEYAAEKYEQIADLYEEMKLYDEARQTREKARQTREKEKEVIIVDLNKLIQQVKDGGIVVIYRCPHCNAPLKISKDTNVESLRVCEHCGSEIEAVDVADFLRTALS
jgi:DNA-directed RNA polymerase subunit RPC12/RpoP